MWLQPDGIPQRRFLVGPGGLEGAGKVSNEPAPPVVPGEADGIMSGVQPDAEVEPGTLLVAAPSLLDSNFRRTVVFVIDHRGEGTLGVVLNRPSEDRKSVV